ncbi:MAG TPA: type II CAAX endopeptidase family protein [Rhodanobacteraceae bacterium]|jgi:membrane protease YdiL (CAAX protease family)|nr:type II CAAX endopeptidase family protein [Rhodanobacteraceae bacterium]
MDLPTENTPTVIDAAVAPQPAPKRPGVWSGLGIVALYFLLQFGLGILFGVIAGFVLMFKAAFVAGLHHRAPPNARVVMQGLMANPDTRVIFIVATIAAAAAVMILLIRQFWRVQWSRAELPGFGFAPPAKKSAYLVAVLLGAAVLFLGGPLTHLLAGHQQVNQDVSVLAGNVSIGMRLLLAVLVVCVAPFVEELVFRGVLLSGLARRMPIGWAMLGSAIVFGCVHLPDFKFAWYPVPALVILGLASAWLRVRTRSLWPSITLHATNNFIAAIAWFVAVGH